MKILKQLISGMGYTQHILVFIMEVSIGHF